MSQPATVFEEKGPLRQLQLQSCTEHNQARGRGRGSLAPRDERLGDLFPATSQHRVWKLVWVAEQA